ncbi:NACHT domain-containing protein [Spelaeicoccus albus]
MRRAFNGFLTAGDVLADLSMLSTNVNQAELGTALEKHARSMLVGERRVYFDEAGYEGHGVPVEDVAIDLPVLVGNRQTSDHVIAFALERGERVLKPGLTTVAKPRHLVLTGAPGNGKSTVSKFLTHAYRAVFLGEDLEIGDDQLKTVASTTDALVAMGVRVPKNRRWPMNIDLARFAIEQGTADSYSLLHWIATTLTGKTASKDIPRWELWEWLKHWPSFIVLDGLDEVSEPSVRKALIANLETFAAEAESERCDMLIMVTTRPTGYQDELPSEAFERIDLTDLAVNDALRYGQLVTKLRLPDDEARQDRIMSQLQQAAQDDRTKHLLRTPLQTLIMSIIAESAKQFAPSRYELFWGYYSTIAKREQNKNSSLSRLLREHALEVLELHRRVGLLLQKEAETATGTDAVLSPLELRNEAWKVLAEAEYEPETRDQELLERIVKTATHRLVLLTPRPGGGFGFDVRSLQELMAAFALTTGPLEETIPRLRRIAPSPHWRNTFLFAAGRLFTEPQPYQQRAITDLVLTLDEDAPERFGSMFPVGPNVAADIIDDGMIAVPKFLRHLVAHAMSALNEPAGFELTGYTRMLMSAAATSDAVRGFVADGLRDALGGPATSRENAEAIQGAITDIGRATGACTAVLGLASVRRDASKTLPAEPVANWAAFSDTLHEYAEPDTENAMHTMDGLIQDVQAAGGFRDQQLGDLVAFLDEPDNVIILGEALCHVAAGSPRLMAILRQNVLPGLWRRPVDLGDDSS